MDNNLKKKVVDRCMRNHLVQRVANSPIGSRIASGSFWSLSGNVMSKGVLLLSSIIVAHILGRSEYGAYSTIRTTIFLFFTLASVGVGSLTTKYVSQFRESNLQKAYNIYVVSTLFSVIFGLATIGLIAFTSTWIATSQLDDPSLASSLNYGAILLFFCTLNAAQAGTLTGFEDFRHIAQNTLISSIVETVSIALMAMEWGINGAIIGSAGGYIVLTIINHYYIKKHFGNRVSFKFKEVNKDEIEVIWVFGIPAALCNVLVLLALWLSRTYLVRETSFGEVAIYNVADQIKTMVLFIPMTLSTILLPILTSVKYGSKDGAAYNKILKYNILINVGITFCIGLILSVLANPILSLWGKGFDRPAPLIILCGSAVFASFATVVGQAIASQGKMWAGFVCNLIWSVLVLSLSFLFIKKGYGATGLALAIMIAYFIHGIYQYAYLKYLLRHQG